jgi:hypothetical protein
MATYQIIDLQTGEFRAVTLDEAAEISSLDPHDIEWAIEEYGLCETDTFQITKLSDPPEDGHSPRGAGDSGGDPLEGDAGDPGDDEIKVLIPVRIFDTQAEFDAWLLENPADVIRVPWDEPIVRDAVERQRDAVARQLGSQGDGPAKPSAVYHLTREMIALIR